MLLFIKRDRRKLRGSVSLLFALLLPLLCLALLAGIAYAERCCAEYDGVRNLKSAGELALASYSRSLWQNYGLWAVEPEAVDLAECETILVELPDLVGKHIKIDFSAPLYEGRQLQDQIDRYMKLRAPVVMGADLVARIQLAAKSRLDLSQGSALATIQKGHQQMQSYQAYQQGQGQLADLKGYLAAEGAEEDPSQGQSGGLTTDALRGETGADSEEAGQLATPPDQLEVWSEEDMTAGLESLAPLLRHFSRHMLPVYEAMGTQGVSEDTAFDPSFIENLAGKLDGLLDRGLGVTSEAMNLAEYSQLYFPAAINLERQPRALVHLYTPQGKDLQDLAKERPLELEQIASGLQNPKLADTYCGAMITGMRFIPQYIGSQRSPNRQVNYQAWADFLSSALSVLSLGELQIPPQVLKYFIQAADSLRLAQKDYQDLKAGFGLPFWPVEAMSSYKSGQYNISFYYRDYMRLLMYTKPAEQLAASLSRLIKAQEPGPFYTSLRVGLEINQEEVQYDYAYLAD
ncbi:MAG: hypothetical protein Q4D97_00630 [Eubacteriales bacterium]|nr:hypothetical protein [Eubacteriales bacterium]